MGRITYPAAELPGKRLARQQLLLVPDNCKHMLDAVVQLCTTVLLSADDIRILAGSRWACPRKPGTGCLRWRCCRRRADLTWLALREGLI